MTNKNRGFSSIILIIIVILVLGGGYWLWQNQLGSPTSKLVPDDWQTYRNEEYGFEFGYPSNWTIEIPGEGDRFYEESGFFFIGLDRQNRQTNSVGAPILGLAIHGNEKDLDSFFVFNDLKGEKKDVIISGVSARQNLSIGQNGKPAISVGFIVNKNGFLLSSFDSEGDETVNLANQILSTFRFTK
ncbi:MAG: hypothetical protein AAB505_01880 [Patescibacteria group bacterium]